MIFRSTFSPPLLIFACVHLCLSVVPSWAQAPPARPGQPDPRAQVAENPLKPFEWLLDDAWYAEGVFPGIGSSSGMRTYRYTLGGKFIEMQQEVLLRPAGSEEPRRMAVTAILGRNPGTRRLQQWGFARDGSLSISEWDTVTPPAMRFEGRVISSAPWRLRGIINRNSVDEFFETLEVFRDNAWRPHSEVLYSRQGAPPPAGGSGAAGPGEEVGILAPLEGVWTQQIEQGAGKADVELTFGWVLDYNFLRSEYTIRRPGEPGVRPHAISFTGYDAQQRRVVQYGFSEDGGVFTATVTAARDALVFEGLMVGESRRRLRVTYRRTGNDTLVAATEISRDGVWEKAGEATLKRRLD